MKKYYCINFSGVKKIDKKAFLKLTNQQFERDYITWYDDGEHIFIGVCNIDERDVIKHIVNYTGQFQSKYAMWY